MRLQQKLGLILEREDEMEGLVGGCNFLLKAIRHEAFTYQNGSLNFVTNTGGLTSAACIPHLPQQAQALLQTAIGTRDSVCKADAQLSCHALKCEMAFVQRTAHV